MVNQAPVFELKWSLSKDTAIVVPAGLALIAFAPRHFQSFVLVPDVLLVAGVFLVAFVATRFFYEGLDKPNQYKLGLAIMASMFVFGTIGNLVNPVTIVKPDYCAYLNSVQCALTIAAGILTVLALCRMQKTERLREVRDDFKHVKELIRKISPLQVAILVFAIALASVLLPSPLGDARATPTLPFFYFMEVCLAALLIRMFFPHAPLAPKARMFYTLLCMAFTIGATSNLVNHGTVFRIGNRIEVNSWDLIIMNGGGILVLLAYSNWKKLLEILRNEEAPGSTTGSRDEQKKPEATGEEKSSADRSENQETAETSSSSESERKETSKTAPETEEREPGEKSSQNADETPSQAPTADQVSPAPKSRTDSGKRKKKRKPQA